MDSRTSLKIVIISRWLKSGQYISAGIYFFQQPYPAARQDKKKRLAS
jgi:hypothetical protein